MISMGLSMYFWITQVLFEYDWASSRSASFAAAAVGPKLYYFAELLASAKL